MTLRFADQFPLWAIFVFLALVFFASAEIGFFLGTWRQRKSQAEERGLTSTFLGAALGLLAFILAFSFGMAASNHSARKATLLEEANAIGTAYLRSRLLPEQYGPEIRDILREYVDIRIKALQTEDADDIGRSLARSEELHKDLWARVVAMSKEEPGSLRTGLFFADSLNEVIDLHSKRVTAGFRNRVPATIIVALLFVAVMSMTMMGYQAGLTGARTLIPRSAIIFAFSSVLLLVISLDRPVKTGIRANEQALADLKTMMSEER